MMIPDTSSSYNMYLKTIVIRVDASTRIGSGHIMRCLTLARKLSANSCKIIFLSKNHQGNLNEFIKKEGFEVFVLSAPDENVEDQMDDKLWLGCSYLKDANECLKLLQSLEVDLLIVDHYSLDYQWHKIIKKMQNKIYKMKIMVIDDLANRKHDCDILLDQTLGREAYHYKNLVPNHCQLLLGTEFIMLRDEFFKLRKIAKNKRKNNFEIKNLLISIGGTDPNNITNNLLNWLIKLKHSQLITKDLKVVIVLNQLSIAKMLDNTSNNLDWVTIVSNPKSMAQLMLDADIAIGSSGGTAWERCCLGLPSLSIISAENQRFISKNLANLGAIIDLGHFSNLTYLDFSESLKKIMNSTDNYKKMSTQSFACCDGVGANNVTELVLSDLSHDIFLLEANYGDCEVMFNWQSNSEIRKYSHNPEPVKWKQHCDWLKSTLSNNNKHLYMINHTNPKNQLSEPLGILRLDAIESSQYREAPFWKISILIAVEHQGKKIALKAINKIPNIYKKQGIVAEVHEDNTASHRLFSRAGFTTISPTAYFLKN
ncbi:MAG: UDP-2,4-diacetamido-2,4,6-trideoxy-beta-L-altropyranose hydrolase [Colwellia sp.]